MPPFSKVLELVGTHIEKETVVADAINFTKELFCKPKQPLKPEPVQSCTPLIAVLPHTPLKSHIGVAPAHEEPAVRVVVHAGKAGGNGAGVVLNVRLQLFNVPAFAVVLLSCIQSFQIPFAFCPLFTAPKYPSGKKAPVNGDVPNLIDVGAVAVKQVLV